MKIALVTTTFTIGGAEKQVRDLAAVFVEQGHRVLLISCKGPAQQALPEGVELIELKGQKSVWGLLSVTTKLARILRSWKPDVVHGHMVVANILSRVASICVPHAVVISTAHNVYEGGGKFRIWAYRLTNRFADLTTNVSEEAVARYTRLGVSRPSGIRTVYNGIDFKHFSFSPADRATLRAKLGLSESQRVCLTVGRLVEAKDHANLLDAFRKVVQSRKDVRLLIVGEGPLESLLKIRCAKLGIEAQVSFLGRRSDISELMSCADLFVLSSAWEGFSLVVTEATACLLPVVATDCGGVTENLDGFGHLVPVRESGLLAEAMIEELDKDTDRTGAERQRARLNAMRRFSIDVIAKQWLGIYQELGERRGLELHHVGHQSGAHPCRPEEIPEERATQ